MSGPTRAACGVFLLLGLTAPALAQSDPREQLEPGCEPVCGSCGRLLGNGPLCEEPECDPGREVLELLDAPFAEGKDGAAASSRAKKEEKDEDEDEDDGEDERWFAVHAGWAHTVTGGTLRDVTILSRNGRIAAIASNLVLPADTEELDARGMHVYPGLVAFDSGGLVGNPPEDATDVYGLNMVLALSTGLTTVGAGTSIAKLTYGTLEGHVLGKRTLMRLDYSSAKARSSLRETLEKVRAHRRKLRAAELAKARGEEVEPPKPLKGKLAGYARLLSGEARAYFKANSTRELTDLANLCLRYGIRGVVAGGTEAWTVAPLLGRAGLGVIVSPRGARSSRPDPRSSRESGWRIENAAILHQHGVPVVIVPRGKGVGTWGLAGNDLFTLPLEAAFGIRGGLPADAALEAITLGPARFLGVDDQIGSIELGKDMDLVIARGDILHYGVLPEWTVVNGRVAYDKDQESLLRHVRPRDLGGENLPLPDLWPRPPGSGEPEMPERER